MRVLFVIVAFLLNPLGARASTASLPQDANWEGWIAPGMSGAPRVLEYHGKLVLLGQIDAAGHATVGNIATWDGTRFEALPAVSTVHAQTIWNDRIVVATRSAPCCASTDAVLSFNGTGWDTLGNVTGLPAPALSAMVGRLCAMVSVFIPGYLLFVMVGRKRALEVMPAIVACGVSFAGMQFLVSNYVGAELTDIVSSLTCILVMIAVLKLWKPASIMRLEGDRPASATVVRHSGRELALAWLPYLLLVIYVLAWGEPSIKKAIDTWTNGLLPASMDRITDTETRHEQFDGALWQTTRRWTYPQAGNDARVLLGTP